MLRRILALSCERTNTRLPIILVTYGWVPRQAAEVLIFTLSVTTRGTFRNCVRISVRKQLQEWPLDGLAGSLVGRGNSIARCTKTSLSHISLHAFIRTVLSTYLHSKHLNGGQEGLESEQEKLQSHQSLTETGSSAKHKPSARNPPPKAKSAFWGGESRRITGIWNCRVATDFPACGANYCVMKA